MSPFKGFEKVDKLESKYHLALKLDSKNQHEQVALYTKLDGGYNQKFLIKTISKEHTKAFTPEMYKQIVDQIRIMQSGIEGILRVIEVLETHDNYYIVTESFEGGDIEQKKIMTGSISEKNCAFIIHKILEVLDQLHGKNVIHRDIRPANIVFLNKKHDDFNLKVQGFDHASSLTNSKVKANKSDMQYIPPEVLSGHIGNAMVDVWAVGVLAFHILDEISPFLDETDEGTKENIIKHHISFDSDAWKHVSAHCKDFITKCLNKDPSRRPTVEELLEHPFIKQANH